ncbi:MAG: hypothetical protein R3D33_03945 [Hyphomicrobiaceae bacterium]
MLAGGLWLAIWRRGWRLIGLAGIALGVAAAVLQPKPDLLVGRSGRPVAIRLADGRLSVTGGRGGSFAVRQWLEADGDRRPPSAAMKGEGFACDGAGCIARLHGLLIAIPDGAEALRDDCETADILITTETLKRRCSHPRLIIDRRTLREQGALAIEVDAGALRVSSVAENRGLRPWSRSNRKPPPPKR